MIRLKSWQQSTLSVLLFTSAPALALNGATQPHQGMRVEVTPAGAFYRPVDESAVARTPSSYKNDLTSGVIWTHTDGGLGWIATAVSIGNFGSEVFTEYDQNNQAAEA